MSDKKSLLPALITQAIHYVILIFSTFDYNYSGQGWGLGLIIWIISLVPAGISILQHIMGAFLNISHEKKIIPIIYLILGVLAIPLFFITGMSGSAVDVIIWNTYYFVLFLIPLICCLKKHN